MTRALAAALLACAATGLAPGARAETLAILNAKIETAGPLGVIERGGVLVRDGRIVKVGPDVVAPAGAIVVDAAGKVVTPGFFAASSSLMAEEVEAVSSTRDDTSRGKLGAAFDISYGLNPASTLVPLARNGGVTRAVITPVGGRGYDSDEEEAAFAAAETAGGGAPAPPAQGLFAGQAAAVRLTSEGDPLLRARLGMVVDLGDAGASVAGSHGGAVQLLKTALEDARAYAALKSSYERGASRTFSLPGEDLEALQPVLKGQIPLLVRVHRASDIRQVLRLAAAERVRVILEGAEEGWIVAPELAAAKVPVLLDTEADLPEQFESLGSRLDNAARLQKAGVLVVIEGSRSLANYRQARFNAGTAVANGLPYEAALRAVTLNAAAAWGLSDALGSLEPGKAGDLVIWSGDPFETSTFPEKVFIDGREQSLRSREDALRDRYAKPDGEVPAAYR